MLLQLLPAEDDARVLHHVPQQGELLGGEAHLLALAEHLAGVQVELQLPHLQHGGLAPLGLAQQHPQPGQQLLKGEGLYQVVVGPGVQARHPVLDAVPGGEQQHGHLVALPPQPPHHLDAVHLGHHDVQHQGVVLRPQQIVEHRRPVKAGVHAVARLLQALFQQLVQVPLVLRD